MSDTIRTRAFNLAMDFIKVYVIRGDSVDDLAKGCGGRFGWDGKVQIGGYIHAGVERYGDISEKWQPGMKLKKLKADEIGVEQVGSERCCEVFKLIDVFRAVEDKYIPTVAAVRRKMRGES
jgi:hypothetical protein